MIKLNGKTIPQNHFPDGTLLMKINEEDYNIHYDKFGNGISWFYEDDSELFSLICLTKYIKEISFNNDVVLFLPYIPHARQDRVQDSSQDIFTLKYFCDIINSLNFASVIVRDPHSDVAAALLDRITVLNPLSQVRKISDFISLTDCVFYYPDAGAAKRYGSIMENVYTYGNKRRDWETGEILGLEIVNSEIVKDKDVLIIDDICSKGGTFYHSAKALKEAGAKNIYLYVTHCENTIFEGELLKDNGLIEKIFTTDSILTKQHEKIILVRKEREDEND